MAIPIESVTTGGFSMRFFRFGEGERVMVILPGLSVKSVMLSATSIAKQYALFKKDFTVYVFDRRAEIPQPYPLEQMAEDTAAAMQCLQLKDTYLFGASQGGMLAALITARHPSLVKKLVLGSSAAAHNDISRATIGTWVELAKKGDAQALYANFCEKIYPPDFYQKYKELFRAASADVSEAELARFITLAENIEGFDMREALAAIRCPVLAIGSEDDAVLGGEATEEIYRITRAVTQAQCYLYTDRGHDAYDTAPDYGERLYRFFMH